VVEAISPNEAFKAAKELLDLKALALVVASKFGPKNPELENIMLAQALKAAKENSVHSVKSAQSDQAALTVPVMAASKLFGRLNFPRRLGGAVLNAAVKRLYEDFFDDLTKAATFHGLKCPIYLLKADGGVMDMPAARERPVLALAAGPAASLLGLWALSGDNSSDDVLMIDMGGTSTDLALLSRGKPLMTPSGLTLAEKPTLVRGLLTHSLALGGDTDLVMEDGRLVPKPIRRGPALALDPSGLGNRSPTLTDAFNVLGLCSLGDTTISKKAFEILAPSRAKEAASLAVEAVFERLNTAAKTFIDDVNRQPVYTISDYLVDWKLKPVRAVFLGGPAETLAPLAEKALSIPSRAPIGAATANALGAALAKPTMEAQLYADTAMGVLSAPTLGCQRSIGFDYTVTQAKEDLLALMGGGADLRITAEECFSQLSEAGRSGKVIRVAAQSAPGLMAGLSA
jgi:N-methylhydantoinase A/oxoprolinase/acetone carboxylase beta subunit